jgi:hypothetical protein
LAVPVVEHALISSKRPLLKGCSPLDVCSGRPVRRALDIVVELVPLDHGEKIMADTLTDVRDEIRTGVVEVSRRLEQHARDKANAHRPRQLRLIESDTVMVAEVEPRNKLYLDGPARGRTVPERAPVRDQRPRYGQDGHGACIATRVPRRRRGRCER